MSELHYKKKTSQIIIKTHRDHLFKFSYDTFIQSHPYNQYHKLACFVTFVAATVFFEFKVCDRKFQFLETRMVFRAMT